MKLPWRKWYPSDWLGDPAIARATAAARGVWIEALNVMMASKTFFVKGTVTEIARMLRCSSEEIQAAIESLKIAEVAEIKVECHHDTIVTVTPRQIEIVTLISRRLERECKRLETTRLRVQKHRSKPQCNANVASAPLWSLASGTSGTSKGGVGGTPESNGHTDDPIEPPRHFPKTKEDATRSCVQVGCDESFATMIWNKAMSRGGLDAKGIAINSWAHHLATEWSYEQQRRAQNKATNGSVPAWAQIKALDEEILKHRANRESSLYDRNCTDLDRASLRALRKKRSELNSQIANT